MKHAFCAIFIFQTRSSVEYNAVQHAGLFGTLMIFGIPAVILISGFVVWYRRRKA